MKEQVRDPKETFSAFTAIADAFGLHRCEGCGARSGKVVCDACVRQAVGRLSALPGGGTGG